jgi:hypothetical protein
MARAKPVPRPGDFDRLATGTHRKGLRSRRPRQRLEQPTRGAAPQQRRHLRQESLFRSKALECASSNAYARIVNRRNSLELTRKIEIRPAPQR